MIEKINDKVYVKEIFNEHKHTPDYAINNSDTELLEYLFEEYHYTYDEFGQLISYCIDCDNLEMIKFIVNNVMNTYSNADDRYWENGMSHMIDNLLIEANRSSCSKEIIDYLKQFDY